MLSSSCTPLYVADGTQSTPTPIIISANEITFDPTASGLPATDVQAAIDSLAGTIASPMQSEVLGLAYGSQAGAGNNNILGLQSSTAAFETTSIFNRDLYGNPQVAQLFETAIVENNTHDDENTDLVGFTGMINNSLIMDTKLRRATALMHRFGVNSVDMNGSVVIGHGENVEVVQGTAAIIMKSTFDTPQPLHINTDNAGCVYIGNQRQELTLNDGDVVFSEFSRWFFRMLPNGTTLWILYYNPATGEITFGTIADPVVPFKRSLTAGISYGYGGTSNQSEICGQGTLDLHESVGPAFLSNVSAIGYQNLAGLNPAIAVTDTMIVGSRLVANALTSSVSNSFISTNRSTMATITGINSNVVIMPVANSLNSGGVASLSRLIAISTNTITLPTGSGIPRSRAIVISNGPVTLGLQQNLIVNSSTASTTFPQQNDNVTGGNMVFIAGVTHSNYDFPAARTSCIVMSTKNSGTNLYPTRDEQFVCTATSYRLNMQSSTFTPGNIISKYKPLVLDLQSKEVSFVPYNNGVGAPEESFGSRKYVRRSPVVEITPGVLSTATFTMPPALLMTDADFDQAAYQLTVRVKAPTNASNTKFYTTQVHDINLITRVLTANVYETDSTTNTTKNATGTLEVSLLMSI